jgi:flagellar hook assembly protein FlgD
VVALDSTSGTINKTENFTGEITPYYFLVKTAGSGIEVAPGKPSGLMLSADSPFINSTVIMYRIPEEENKDRVTLKIYNLSGRLVRMLVDEKCSSGYHTFTWDGNDVNGIALPSGIYFCQLKVGDTEEGIKLSRVK